MFSIKLLTIGAVLAAKTQAPLIVQARGPEDPSGRHMDRVAESVTCSAAGAPFAGPVTLRCAGGQSLGACALALAVTSLAWIWAFAEFADQRAILGAGLLAYTFGLRDAVDSQHVAVIDATILRMPRPERRLPPVGLLFALGHSTVVAIGLVSVAAVATALASRSPQFEAVSAILASGTSGALLAGIAALDVVALGHVWARFRLMRRADPGSRRPAPTMLGRPFPDPLRFVFRLGLGRATEIVLLGIVGAQAAEGGSMSSIFVLPGLFTAGVVLIDATDGLPMVHAWSCALADPLRGIWHCLALTVASAVAALFLCGDGVVGPIAEAAERSIGSWSEIARMHHLLAVPGYGALGFCILSLILSAQACRGEYRSGPGPGGSSFPSECRSPPGDEEIIREHLPDLGLGSAEEAARGLVKRQL